MLAGCRGDAFWLNNVVLCRIDGSTIEEKEGSYMDLRVRGPSGEVVDGKKQRGRVREHLKIIEPQTVIVFPEEIHATGIANDDAGVFATAWFFVREDFNWFLGVGVKGEGLGVV